MGLRIRTLKPEILTDEKSAALTDTEWRLFVSCIVMSDDYGNFRASPAFLHSQAFWAASTSREGCAKAIETLARLSLVTLYEVGGQAYGHISGWAKHQRVDHPGKPSCPQPKQTKSNTCENSSRGSRETGGKIPDTLPTDRDLDQEGKGKGNAPRVSDEAFLPDTPDRLVACIKAAVEKARPERGFWDPGAKGSFVHQDAAEFLRGLGDVGSVAPEVMRRILLFAKDDRMAPWTFAKFRREYNGIGVERPQTGNVNPQPKANWGKPVTMADVEAARRKQANG